MLTWRFFCHVEFESLRLEFHRRKRRIWRRSEEIEEDEEKNLRRKKKNRRTYGNRKNTKKKRTYRRTWRWKEPTEEESWRTKKKNGPGEHKKSSFKYSIFTWIFFHIRLPSHATQVVETRVPPLNSSFRVSQY